MGTERCRVYVTGKQATDCVIDINLKDISSVIFLSNLTLILFLSTHFL